jgi:hypothetical protein
MSWAWVAVAVAGPLGGAALGWLGWQWMRAVGDLLWIAVLRPRLTAAIMVLVLIAVLLPAGLLVRPWSAAAIAVLMGPVLGKPAVNAAAWWLALRRFRSAGGREAILFLEPTYRRPLWRAFPGQRRSALWQALRRTAWASREYAFGHRRAELVARYRRPPIRDDPFGDGD